MNSFIDKRIKNKNCTHLIGAGCFFRSVFGVFKTLVLTYCIHVFVYENLKTQIIVFQNKLNRSTALTGRNSIACRTCSTTLLACNCKNADSRVNREYKVL